MADEEEYDAEQKWLLENPDVVARSVKKQRQREEKQFEKHLNKAMKKFVINYSKLSPSTQRTFGLVIEKNKKRRAAVSGDERAK